jgi:hypothetical protein
MRLAVHHTGNSDDKMTSNSRLAHGSNNSSIHLMLHSIRTFREIAEACLRNDKVAKDVKGFCRRLRVHCYLIEEPAERIFGPENHLIQVLLIRFQTIITPSFPESLCSPLDLDVYSLLWDLNCEWDNAKANTGSDQLERILSYLIFGSNPQQQGELLSFLDRWLEEVDDEFPEDNHRSSLTDYIPQRMKRRVEPSYAVCTAAQAVHDALLTVLCSPLRCRMKHEYGAQLCLGTYRQLVPEDSFDFDMFLAVEQSWQETRIRTPVKKSYVTFAFDGPPKHQPINCTDPQWRARNLCDILLKIRTWPSSWRLKFEVEDQYLRKMASELSSLAIDGSKEPLSLQDFLNNHPKSLTEKTKRILTVLLSYAVFYLHGTTWLGSSWGASDILFFTTKSGTVPLRPFFCRQLIREQLSTSPNCAAGPDDERGHAPNNEAYTDPDDLLSHHPCSNFVTMAILLLEIHLATPFQNLAKQCGIEISNSYNDSLRFLQAFQVFKAYETEIPENSLLRTAIQNCLLSNLWEDGNGKPYSTQELREQFYHKVVSLLEDELEHAFSYISTEKLDTFAPTVDFCNWGQSTWIESTSDLPPTEIPAFPLRSRHTSLDTLGAGNLVESERRKVRKGTFGGMETRSMKFFDDEPRPQTTCARA